MHNGLEGNEYLVKANAQLTCSSPPEWRGRPQPSARRWAAGAPPAAHLERGVIPVGVTPVGTSCGGNNTGGGNTGGGNIGASLGRSGAACSAPGKGGDLASGYGLTLNPSASVTRPLRNMRPPTDSSFVCHTPYNIGDGNIL